MGSLQQDNEGAAQRERISRSSKVPSHWLGPRMNCLADDFENSTQVRRLFEPARPCQVRAAQEDEQTLDCEQRLRAGEVEGLDCDGETCGSEPCDAADKGSKQERKKQPGYNKKHVRNINDIIEKDQKM